MNDFKVYAYITGLSIILLLALFISNDGILMPSVQIIAILAMATLGVLHGANDLWIYRRSTESQISTLNFIFLYVSMAFLIGLIVFLEPVVGVNLFVLLSAYHFGEEHFSWWKEKKNAASILWCFFYGLSIFSLLFLTHLETLEAFFQTSNYKVKLVYYILQILSTRQDLTF